GRVRPRGPERRASRRLDRRRLRQRGRADGASRLERAHRSVPSAVMDVDVAVLGGGPGGYTAAIRAAQLGATVACIEREPELGGTCLRVGCIPTKAWVQTAHFLHQAEETFGKLGVRVDGPQLDFAAANEWKANVVNQMT